MIPQMQPSQEQLERVRRWYIRFKNINDGRDHNRPSEHYQDEVYAFFMNCYHLKDFLIYDPAANFSKNKVEKFINNSVDLSLCADLCNGLKHLQLSTDRSGQSPRFANRKNVINIGSGPITISVNYSVDSSTGYIDAFDLATRCMEAWEKFVSSD